MKTDIKNSNNNTIIAFHGRINAASIDLFKKELFECLNNSKEKVILDLKKIDYISSAGLRVLLEAQKEYPEGKLKLINVISEVNEIFVMTGFNKFLDITLL